MNLAKKYNGMAVEGRELIQYHQRSEVTREQLDYVLLARMFGTGNSPLDYMLFQDEISAEKFKNRLQLIATEDFGDIPRAYLLTRQMYPLSDQYPVTIGVCPQDGFKIMVDPLVAPIMRHRLLEQIEQNRFFLFVRDSLLNPPRIE